MAKLFVYGTLRKNGPWHWFLTGDTFLGTGTLTGQLFVNKEFVPLLVYSPDQRVKGELYEINEGGIFGRYKWSYLDELEQGYTRKETIVSLEDGSKVKAYAYFWENKLPVGTKKFKGADYITWINKILEEEKEKR